MEKIKFDDIDSLQKFVSEDFGEFGKPVEITQDLVNQFADLTGDHQWIHVDVEKAKAGPLGTTIAHGFLTLSLLSMMLGEEKPAFLMTGVQNALNYGSDKLRFLSPVPVGSSVHMRSRLVSAELGKKGTRLEREAAIHVVGSERPALLYSMITLHQG